MTSNANTPDLADYILVKQAARECGLPCPNSLYPAIRSGLIESRKKDNLTWIKRGSLLAYLAQKRTGLGSENALINQQPTPALYPNPFHSQTLTVDIKALRNQIGRWLSIAPEDADVVDVTLAVFNSNKLPGDPVWLELVDASGAGKTELLRAFRGHPDCYSISKLTENSLVSGYREATSNRKKVADDPSLLPKLDGKVLIIKDLSPILAMRAESRSAILGALRDAYDGIVDEGKGNIGKVSYQSKFSVIAGCTLAVDRSDSVDKELGERFIRYRARGNQSLAKIKKSLDNLGQDVPMRAEIEKIVTQFLASLPKMFPLIPPAMKSKLAELADFTAKARSPVARDRAGDLQYHPRPEVGTRLAKELGKLLVSLAIVRGKLEPDEEDFKTIQRIADDCLPPNRLLILNQLRAQGKMRQSEIEKAVGLPDRTCRRVLDDLKVLGITDCEIPMYEENSKRWFLATH